MTAPFNDVDLEMGLVSGNSFEGALMDDYDVGYDDHYGEDASSPTHHSSTTNPTSTDGEGVLITLGRKRHLQRPDHFKDGGCTKREKYDDKSGNGYVESVLLFIGLFSVAVTPFIVESYKKPSPDPTEHTVALLNQLMIVSRGTPLEPPSSPDSVPLRSVPPAVRASTLWFLSLGLNIACAIWAITQWQRSTGLLGRSGEPHSHARVRASYFSGIGRRDMERTVEAIWVLLHTSVFLFFIGIVDFLLQINKTVAYIVLAYTVPLMLAYIATTFLLCFFPNSRFFTPPSSGSWKVSQLDSEPDKSQSSFRRAPSDYNRDH